MWRWHRWENFIFVLEISLIEWSRAHTSEVYHTFSSLKFVYPNPLNFFKLTYLNILSSSLCKKIIINTYRHLSFLDGQSSPCSPYYCSSSLNPDDLIVLLPLEVLERWNFLGGKIIFSPTKQTFISFSCLELAVVPVGTGMEDYSWSIFLSPTKEVHS